ncbi:MULTISPECIES: hypothetical protein [Clostridium]|uniref:Uncharacterized protein n=1 Tax=Clostridium ragsdalei P11 TaxID=1353534 RepID=A0A1A6AVX4_9CLOT|nr:MULTISPECIES: hypothetical protein [Clostridium]OBR94234.1 hypothetical protein CLRAG_16250 [Clostridium ragsdalei P11]QXE18260.1 hypothetical protein B5S50_05085 [Clostridium sp. 001]
MRVHPIIKSNNEFCRNLNSERENRHKKNNGTGMLFYEMLEKDILENICEKMENAKKVIESLY